MSKLKNYMKTGLHLVIFVSIVLFIFSIKMELSGNNNIITDSVDVEEHSSYFDTIRVGPVFSEDSLKKLIKDLNLKHRDIVFAQAKLESGNFQSKLFKENNNLFGMKHPRQRITVSRGSKNGYSDYDTWEDSVLDYAFFQASFMRGLSRQEYFKYLNRNYAKDSSYIIKLNEIIKKERTL